MATTMAEVAAGFEITGRDLMSLAIALAAFGLVYMLWRAIGATLQASVFERFLHNWRLALLGATGIVLSVASGWTTWDGMRNFTKEPVLSLMITFGIQGVMLIVAWLIGETFATGMSARPAPSAGAAGGGLAGVRPLEPRASGLRLLAARLPNYAGMVMGILLATALTILFLQSFGVGASDPFRAETLTGLSNNLLMAAAILLLFALIGIVAGGAVIGDYARGIQVMVRSVVLWIMFLACMATSVFFSFDSLFSTIFPQEERERAAELRAQNQVAGVVADIGNVTSRRRIAEQEQLFEHPAWARYDGELAKVIAMANQAPGAIRDQIAGELELQRRRIAELEEKRATAEGGQAGLVARKTRISAELTLLQSERPEASSRVAEFQAVVAGIEKRLDEQKALTLAEERGVEGTGRVGRGPQWRASRAAEQRIASELEVANQRLGGHATRLREIDQRMASIKAQLAEIDGELAKLRGEAQTAQQLIAVAETTNRSNDAQRFDPAASVTALEKARQEFRTAPETTSLAQLQRYCLDLQNAGLKVAALRDRASGIDCDPGAVSEAASRVFALNVGLQALAANCIGGDKLPQSGGADALFSFARRCVQDSGLPSDATDDLRRQINIIELNRDDKAHRFVVTTNAFQDGNKLAYLALAIAIAIDALVFMSGLFGANALRSPLSDVPSHKGRSARQLEDIVENALLPDKFENATLALEAVHPATLGGGQVQAGWTHEVVIPASDIAHRTRLLRVLNAGATIGAVARDPDRPERYLVRAEFVEFLSGVAKRAFETDREKVRLAELKKILVVALQPFVGDHADIVLGYLKPISEKDGFSSEVCLDRDIADPGHRFIVQKAVNAGTTLDYVQKDTRKGEEDRFYLHRDFYRVLATVASEFPRHGRISAHPMAALTTARAGHLALDPGASESPPPLYLDGPEDLARAQKTPKQPTVNVDIAAHVTASFLEALDLDDAAYRWAYTNAGAATASMQALASLTDRSDAFGQLVAAIDSESMDAIARTYAALAHRYDGNGDAFAVLASQRREIENLLPLLLIAPDGRYRAVLRDAIDDLERAEGSDAGLRPAERDLLERLRRHRSEIGREQSVSQALESISRLTSEPEPTQAVDIPVNVARFPPAVRQG
ncbi:MAG: hypothetical protein ACFCUN_13220 [Hyphomicrobiaceae bacterium]